MDWRREWKVLAAFAAVFLAFYFLPVGAARFDRAVGESLALTKEYARDHVVTCLVPALFIAGAIAVFVRQGSVLRLLGPRAPRTTAYGVAAVGGTILAVCSCTVLPLFAGIYKRGAGLGPATTFLYAGPAINALAIILTARVLGFEIGLARAVGAVVFSILIGLIMHRIFRREELERADAEIVDPDDGKGQPVAHVALLFAAMVAVLVFANWGGEGRIGSLKWPLTASAAAAVGVILSSWFGLKWWKLAAVAASTTVVALAAPDTPVLAFSTAVVGLSVFTATDDGELGSWFASGWDLAKQILPLLIVGVLVAGALLGRPGREGLIPSGWIAAAVGGNSIAANLFASVAGALMYFATLTEVPILQGLLGNGMGEGPALALLLAGPALSLPNMLVIAGVLGWRKTVVYVVLVVVMATASGIIYGALVS
jgi:uncharacterized membrane protein YraQ (UPF0718 family)